MEGTIYSLIPAILMLLLVIVTRRVILSLGAGILVGALMLSDFHVLNALMDIWNIFAGIFVSDGALNTGNIYLLVFLLLLGMTTAFMTASGGSYAFGRWAIQKIKTRQGAQGVPAILGVIIFIDDYFNALAVGQVARPLTDRYKISRAKLAYFIDSTSAPVTVISPISSWGAYIIGTIGTILAANEITDYQALEAFVKMIPANFYVFAALLLVFMTAYLKVDIGPMRRHEKRAIETGELHAPGRADAPGDLDDEFETHHNGKIRHLLWPILGLVLGTVGAMIWTGASAAEGSLDALAIFANTNVNLSLFIGGLLAVLLAGVMYASQPQPKSRFFKVIVEGIKAMLPALYILIFARVIGTVIGNLKTGEYLAQVIQDAAIATAWLPLLIFIVSGGMALATGTSWGTFGIMLPIAGEIAAVTDIGLVLPALAAVLAGSVFGDHCSPISDTTVLSSTGAGANHIDHVLTQLPYAFIAAGAASLGYVVLGFTGHLIFALLATLAVVAITGIVLHVFTKNLKYDG
ncbi:Na+/H+ antiporter NhaC family protein [Thalassobacillus sp. CUG 92003]|uniref:Na+/H+ antiporter NhaC family protein n=1 Tax=Thalassobacillus sp. CUG 92003 TaxID=2736641 RepID=UPI0015E68F40|nr:Na+/H+ antiporter NhaC family protein [Thalassobacillus sp. CUG 92003]